MSNDTKDAGEFAKGYRQGSDDARNLFMVSREQLATALAAFGMHMLSGGRMPLDQCCANLHPRNGGKVDDSALAATDIVAFELGIPLARATQDASLATEGAKE